ncbi:MAG: hypothetical protein IRY99_09835 [Isosphaeraceae bacterium]|nr:hypothetical protein [Isosphaeraceae bacterium]
MLAATSAASVDPDRLREAIRAYDAAEVAYRAASEWMAATGAAATRDDEEALCDVAGRYYAAQDELIAALLADVARPVPASTDGLPVVEGRAATFQGRRYVAAPDQDGQIYLFVLRADREMALD